MKTFTVTAREQLLQHAASVDGYRPTMNGVNFKDGYAMATNGHVLAITLQEKIDNEPRPNGTIRFDSPKQKGLKTAGVGIYERVGESERYATPQGGTADTEDYGHYPDIAAVLPTTTPETVITLNLSVKELTALAKALDAGKDQMLTLQFDPTTPQAPVLVCAANRPRANDLGAIMPLTTYDITPDLYARAMEIQAALTAVKEEA